MASAGRTVSSRTNKPYCSATVGYFASADVLLLERKDSDVEAFMEKERERWDVVYDEVLPEKYGDGLEFFPGDRVKIVGDVKVKEVDVKGRQGTVRHYEFDDGYEACQTCSTTYPVTVILDDD